MKNYLSMPTAEVLINDALYNLTNIASISQNGSRAYVL